MSQEAYDMLQAAIARRRALEDNLEAYQRGHIPPHYPVPARAQDVSYMHTPQSPAFNYWLGITFANAITC